MTRKEIIDKVKALNWPRGSYVVFGSCPMTMAGLREANDIDFLVSEELFAKLKLSGWKEAKKASGDYPLAYDVFEAHKNWDFSPYSPTLEHLLSTATILGGIPFASLKEVRKWKAASGRPKDLPDIQLIDNYLKNN